MRRRSRCYRKSLVRTYVRTGEPRGRAATVRASSNLSQKEKPMPPATTRPHDLAAPSTLYLAFELGNAEWELGLMAVMDQAPLLRAVPARALETLDAEITRAKAHFGLPA